MSSVSRWRDSGHLQRAVETAGGQEAFEDGVADMLDDARGWRLADMREARPVGSQREAGADSEARSPLGPPGTATRAPAAGRRGC